jgi:hypothetical protein
VFKQDPLSLGAVRELIGPIEIAMHFLLIERPLLAGHAAHYRTFVADLTGALPGFASR